MRAIDGIDLIAIPLDESQSDFDIAILSADEKARGAKLLGAKKRERWIRCRAALRQVLSSYLEVPPDELVFEYDRHGKPWVDGIYFSLSHSDNQALLAVSDRTIVGVDIELASRSFNLDAIASQLLHDIELNSWHTMDPIVRTRSLLEAWTSKEAIFKALGIGILSGLKKIRLPILPIPEIPFQPSNIELGIRKDLLDPVLQSPHFSLEAENWRIAKINLPLEGSAAIAYLVPNSLRQFSNQGPPLTHWLDRIQK